MSDFSARLAQLQRPRTLVGAARKGLSLYRRDRDLPRLVGPARDARVTLLEREEQLERTRQTDRAIYSASAHVAVLTALLAEAAMV